MNLTQIIKATRRYARDTTGRVFTDDDIKAFIDEAVRYLKRYKPLKNMPYITDKVLYLPEEYHDLIPLFASSRCFDMDERFHEATEKRNEFELLFGQFQDLFESGNIVLYDEEENEINENINVVDTVQDDYFNVKNRDEDIIGV